MRERNLMRLLITICVFAILFSVKIFAANEMYRAVNFSPPDVPREFRAAWITCVASNADWPSQSGLSVEQQKAELISLLDRAAQLHLNAIIFQVRPASDAMYQSSIEPWSEYLTGAQGRAPEPFYDPLAFAIQEAHKRGLELHAWFNPFRAWHPLSKSSVAANHVTKLHPEWICKYGEQTWLNPGNPEVRDYVLRVVMDVVKRYDVDGVQFDDYFYPYYDTEAGDFPDLETWKQFGLPRHLTIDDWRRANVDQFIYDVSKNVKVAKPWVKFGVSPFGIWRQGYPPQIKGLDAYATIYADSRLWLASGWVDYLAPQLYWATDDTPHSFSVLLNWWAQQNVKGRQVFAAMSAANVPDKFSANEIARQIQTVRTQKGASGEIYFHLKNLIDDGSLGGIVSRENFQMALPPPISGNSFPLPQPAISVTTASTNLVVRWEMPTNQLLKSWLLQCRGTNNLWTTQILPSSQTGCTFSTWKPDIICVSAMDRFGNLGSPAVMKKIPPPPPRTGKAGQIIYMR